MENRVYFFPSDFSFSLCLLPLHLGNSLRQMSANLISTSVSNYSRMITCLIMIKTTPHFKKLLFIFAVDFFLPTGEPMNDTESG